MTRPKQSEEQPFQISREQQVGQFSMQEMAIFGSHFDANQQAIAQVPFVVDVERILPAYVDCENPMRVLRRTSFSDYLDETRPRLEALEEQESAPKVIPKVFEIWEHSENFRGRIG